MLELCLIYDETFEFQIVFYWLSSLKKVDIMKLKSVTCYLDRMNSPFCIETSGTVDLASIFRNCNRSKTLNITG